MEMQDTWYWLSVVEIKQRERMAGEDIWGSVSKEGLFRGNICIEVWDELAMYTSGAKY